MTDKELRILDEMLTNLEIWSTWNKTFSNEMLGICSKMRNLLADRKTEPQAGEMMTEEEFDSMLVRVLIGKAEPQTISKDNVPDTNVGDMVSRQAAIAKFEPWLKVEGYSEGELNMLKAVLYELRSLPSADPVRKKGKWISLDDFRGKYNENGYKCSECGEHSDYEDNFCPNCGADMRGSTK